MNPTDLDTWLAVQPRLLAEVLRQIASACARVSRGAARGILPQVDEALAPPEGDPRRPLSRFAERQFVAALDGCPNVAGWASEESCNVTVSREHGSGGAYLVTFDPLDGVTGMDANGPLASMFSVLPHLFRGTPASDCAFMQPGRRQVAAGYCIYGPSTVLALGTAQGVSMFTLDPDAPPGFDRWLLSRSAVQVPAATTEFAVNVANQRYWEKPVQRYVAECLAGAGGPRGRDFDMRWVSSTVAEVHRILTRGGVFLYPRDAKEPYRPGRLRLMYEAAPLAFLMEKAGGAASNGTAPLLDLVPDALSQRVPVILGSTEEVERIVSYHADPSENVSWQLFKTRSLFIQPNA